MIYGPTWRSRPGVLVLSAILGAIAANALFETPNCIGGGGAKMVVAIVLMVVFKIILDFLLAKWRQRQDKNRRSNKNVSE
jgi:hypothetical protein